MVNIHPMVVHFPIALLTVYAVAELLRFKKLLKSDSWFLVKAVMLWVGILGAFVALQSGEAIEDQFSQGSFAVLVETHSMWAALTSWIFGFLAVMYLIAALRRFDIVKEEKMGRSRIARTIFTVSKIVVDKWIVVLFALFGLFAITVTGALGGAIVHGASVDPVVQVIYDTFVNGNVLGNQSGSLVGNIIVNNTAGTEVVLTLVEVAKHSTAEDCWVVANDKVYAVSSYINSHPGGAQRIISRCGGDITSDFEGKPHSPRAHDILGSFYIGDLNQKVTVESTQVAAQNNTGQYSGDDEDYEDEDDDDD